MRPLDPRLLRRARGARSALVLDAGLGLFATVAVLMQATLLAGIVAAAFQGGSMRSLSGALALLLAVVAARGLLAGGFETVGRRSAPRVMSELRLALVEHRLRRAPLAADGAEAAELALAAVDGVDALESYFARYLPQVVLAMFVPAVVLLWTAALDPISALIMAVTLPVIPLFMVLIGRSTQARTVERWQALSRLANHFLDVVRGLPTLRAFNRGQEQADGIAETSEAYRRATMGVLKLSFLSGAVLDLMATLATALVAVTLGVRLVDGRIGLRTALIVLLLTPELYAPLRGLAAQFHASADGLAAAERILDLIDEPGAASTNGSVPPPAWGAVRVEHVVLTHRGRDERVLDGFDLEIRRGEIVALVGASGSGKTTVASLLLGLRTPDGGAVTVDGMDLADVDLAAWRRQIAWVPQHPTLFRGTVRDNIAMGAPRASHAQIEAAAALAGADGFIGDLRHGYETRIGDGGRGLSAGETRRIALARAFVRRAPLLILDEPTANLDAQTAEMVTRSLRGAAQGRAVLLIEHRPEVAQLADRIVRLERGRAVVEGGMVLR